MTRFFVRGAVLTSLLGCTCLSSAWSAQTPVTSSTTTSSITIPAQDLSGALLALGRQTGRSVTFLADTVAGKRSAAVQAAPSFEAALQQMLAGTGLQFVIAPDGSASVAQRVSAAPAAAVPRREAKSVAEQPPEEVLVTGTRIRGRAPVGSSLVTLDRSAIEEAGFATTPQLVQSLSQNSGLGANEENFSRSSVQNANLNLTGGTGVNLRGLGPGSTLVLVNGRRIAPSGSGSFVDVSQIPLSAVSRVEIVPDGASALYGSDAIGGVANFVLRKDYEGAETSLRYGGAAGFRQVQAAQLAGKKWDGGSALLSYEFNRREKLSAEERDFFTQDLRRFGGADYRTAFANPGTIVANGTTYAIPAGQNGRSLSASQLVAGSVNLQDQDRGTTILPERRDHNLVAVLHQDLSDNVTVFADGYYTDRRVRQSIAAQSSTLSVPRSNPFFVSPVAGAPSVTVQYSFLGDLGPVSYVNDLANYTGTVGAELALPGKWRGQAYGSYSVDDQATRLGNLPNAALLAAALADPNPATAFNPFGDGSGNSTAALDRIRGYYAGNAKYTVRTAAATMDGPLAALPGGDLRLAIGGEYRDETLRSSAQSFQSSATPVTNFFRASRRVKAVYGELLLPLFGDGNRRSGIHRLDLSVAGRYERYSDFGNSANPKVGFSWSPDSNFSLRGSYSTSFQAPTLQQLTPTSAAYVLVPLFDPKAPGGRTTTLLFSSPANPDLRSQNARTWSAGVDLHPDALPGLKAGIGYFDIHYTNLIGSIGSDILNALVLENIYGPLITRNPGAAFVRQAFSSPFFQGVPVDPATVQAFVNAAPTNLGTLRERGLDLSASYRFDTAAGTFGFGGNVTWLVDYRVSQTSTAPSLDRLDTLNNPVDLRMRYSATWNRDGSAVGLFLNYVDGFKNAAVAPVQKVGSWTTLDLNLSHEFFEGALRGVRVGLQVQNLFDRDPPFVNSSLYGYDPATASAVGRSIFVQVRKSW